MGEQKLQECIAAIVSKYDKEKQEACEKMMYVKRGLLKKLIIETKKEFGLDKSIKINEETIQTWEERGQTEIIESHGQHSPLEEIENVFVEFFVEMGMFKQPLSVKEGINLVNTLIEGTKYEQAMSDFQNRVCSKTMKKETAKERWVRGTAIH